jgi:hypothetical protein
MIGHSGAMSSKQSICHYGVHPNLVSLWKKRAIESLPDAFSTLRELDDQGEEALKEELYQQIG